MLIVNDVLSEDEVFQLSLGNIWNTSPKLNKQLSEAIFLLYGVDTAQLKQLMMLFFFFPNTFSST